MTRSCREQLPETSSDGSTVFGLPPWVFISKAQAKDVELRV